LKCFISGCTDIDIWQSFRKVVLPPITAALTALSHRYSSLALFAAEQRFAVGTTATEECVIIVYDLRTATRWRVLDGHTGAVSAVAWNRDGTVLCSYSSQERPVPTARFWRMSGGGLLGNLFGGSGRCTQTVNLAVLPPSTLAPSESLSTIKLQWTSDTTAILIREDSAVTTLTFTG
jgi:WD40 repeat protein